jgi:hypothetical protein
MKIETRSQKKGVQPRPACGQWHMLWGDPFDFAQRRLFAPPEQQLLSGCASKEDRSLDWSTPFVAGLPTKKDLFIFHRLVE